MAQHIPISAFKQKRFRVIENSIRQAFKHYSYIRGSLKYEFLYEEQGLEVWLTNRYIRKGIVYGDDHGSFEIHYDRYNGRIKEIYLVA
jgi:hypothetical protein